jgi:hypothetical protein
MRDFDPVDFWGARDIAPFVGCFRVIVAAVLWGLMGMVIWGFVDFFFVPHLPRRPQPSQFVFPPLEEKGK